MFRKIIAYSLILVLVSCGKDEVIIEEPSPSDESVELVEVNLVGFTTDEESAYIPYGDIHIDGKNIRSDDSGFFHFEKVLIGKRGKIVELNKTGYLPTIYRMINHRTLENVVLNLQLIESPELVSIGESGGDIVSDQCILRVAKDAVNGNTEFIFQTYLGTKANIGNTDPLYFGEKTEFLLKEASIYIEGSSPLIANAEMQIELDTESLSTSEIADLSIFHFDQSKLTWKERNIPILTLGDNISFSVNAYGWWTIAKKVPTQFATLNLKQSNGLGIVKAETQLTFGEEGHNKLQYYTSLVGAISTYFPQDVSVYANLNNNQFKSNFVAGFSEGETQGNIDFDENVQVAFQGYVYACDFSLTDGFATIISEGQHKIQEIINGQFSSEVFIGNDEVKLQFYSSEFEFVSDKESNLTELENGVNNFLACEDLRENLLVLNGSDLLQDFDMCRVKVRPNETIVIGERSNGDIFLVSFNGEEEGTYDGLIYFPLITDEEVNANVTVNIVLYDEVENKVGGFIKTAYTSSGEELTISFIGNIE